jgi:two-component system LytT family response regulator
MGGVFYSICKLLNKTFVKKSKLAIRSYTTLKIVDLEDILYCKGEGRYTWVHIKNESPILSAKVLKDYEDILPESWFLRIHKSYLVNNSNIKSYDTRNGGVIVMDDNESLPIAKRRKKEFINRVNETFGNI